MAPVGAGFLIYSGIMPLIKTFITIFFGYLLARKGLFPQAAARGASQVTMNLALPALIFANIIPAFTPSNVSAIGPLLLIAFAYVAIGFLMGLLIREVCYVPRNFYQGLLVMSGTSNWGNLPTAVVLTVTQQPPFDPSTDPALGVSFVAIFIVAYYLAFWVSGAAHSISWDYSPNVPQGKAAERRQLWREKPIGGWVSRVLHGNKPVMADPESGSQDEDFDEKAAAVPSQEPNGNTLDRQHVLEDLHSNTGPELTRHVSRISIATFRSRQSHVAPLPTFRSQDGTTTPPPLVSVVLPGSPSALTLPDAPSTQPTPSVPQTTGVPRLPFLSRAIGMLSVVVSPITLTLAVSILIALVQPLKALFVDTTNLGGPNWKGPDGRPPLFFLIDTASFVGGITVPMALVLLGASFARLSIPRPISRLALPAMFAMALAKMFFLPVIGVFMVEGMVRKGFIPRENKVERFVAMFLSGTPAAVNQLIVTQLYASDGDVDTLSAFLLVQYALMFFSSAALTAVSLALL